MKPEQTVLRARANRDPRAPVYFAPDMLAHRAAAGLLPMPLLTKVALAGSLALGVAAIALIGAMLGWW